MDICDEDIYADIECFRKFLISELRNECVKGNLPGHLVDEVQLVLEPKSDQVGVICCYYFVSASNRSLFWLDEWDGTEILSSCRGDLSLRHKGKYGTVTWGD